MRQTNDDALLVGLNRMGEQDGEPVKPINSGCYGKLFPRVVAEFRFEARGVVSFRR